jgi:hypothetical protein
MGAHIEIVARRGGCAPGNRQGVEHRFHETDQLPRWTSGPAGAQRRVGKGGRGVTLRARRVFRRAHRGVAGQWRKVVHIRTDRTEVEMQENIVRQIDAHLSATAHAKKCPPASEDAVRFAEASLGLNIPQLLRLIYLNVGNGGFGPGYGIIGVGGGHASNLGTLVETYDQIKKGADYLGITWSARLLPFCEWGCNIFSCVDCGDTDYQMFQSDECRVYAQNYNLEKFFEMWLTDVDIFAVSSSSGKSAQITNPFTRKKVRVTSTQMKGKLLE